MNEVLEDLEDARDKLHSAEQSSELGTRMMIKSQKEQLEELINRVETIYNGTD